MTPRSLTISINRLAHQGDLRDRIRTFLDEWERPDAEIDDIVLVVSELVDSAFLTAGTPEVVAGVRIVDGPSVEFTVCYREMRTAEDGRPADPSPSLNLGADVVRSIAETLGVWVDPMGRHCERLRIRDATIDDHSST